MILDGLLEFSWKGDIIYTLILTQVTIASVTIYLHRHQTHQALTLHPIISHFFRFWLWMTTGLVTKEWVSIHRKHHAKCETKDDPHSPKNWGLKFMLLHGMKVYRAGKTRETIEKYGHGAPSDWIEKNLYSVHEKLGICLMLIIDLMLLGLPGLFVWVVQMFWIPFWAAGVINGVGHAYGYRNFETNDSSTNIFPLAIFVGGEELHNNHHTFPSSAKLSVKWWEFDIGWAYIKILESLRLAKVNREFSLLSNQDILTEKKTLDFSVVRLLINHRLQVLTDYYRQVLLPTWHNENRKSPLPHNTKKILSCAESQWDEKKAATMNEMVQKNATMRLVCQFKISLQQICENKKLNSEELLSLFKKWVDEAQQSGNCLLEKFAQSMPNYVIKI